MSDPTGTQDSHKRLDWVEEQLTKATELLDSTTLLVENLERRLQDLEDAWEARFGPTREHCLQCGRLKGKCHHPEPTH